MKLTVFCRIKSYSTAADITERRKMEKKLKESEFQLRQIIDLVPQFIFVKDETGKFEIVNKAIADAFGTTVEDLTGRRDTEFVTTEDEMEYFRSDDLEVIKSGKIKFIPEETLTDSENNIRYLQTTKVPFKFSATKKPSLLGVSVDITRRKLAEMEREKLQTQLQQAQKMESIGTLAGGIAHDFNNILTSILGYSEMALLDLPDGSHAKKDIDQVISSGKRATDLVRQILTFSRKGQMKLAVLSPHRIVNEALKMIHSSIPTTVKIEEDIDFECGKIKADPTQIHQIVMNLCTNAFQSLKDQKGTIKVKLQRRESTNEEIANETVRPARPFIVLSVSDTGCGMDQVTKNRIFEPYFTTKKTGEGTGLGLAVIQGIVVSYNGFVKVESELGKGTTFHIYLPALENNIT